jgi:hypothetical protein
MNDENAGHLSDFEKGQIIALAGQHLSLSQITVQVSCPKSTIQSFLDYYYERYNKDNLPTPGCPTALNALTF